MTIKEIKSLSISLYEREKSLFNPLSPAFRFVDSCGIETLPQGERGIL
jgi:hypothetical protein